MAALKEKKQNNKLYVRGILVSRFRYDHTIKWEKFYKSQVKISRRTDEGIEEDIIPILVSEVYLPRDPENIKERCSVEIKGQYRSFNDSDEEGVRHLYLYIFVNEINFIEDEDVNYEFDGANEVNLEGFVCKPPFYRKTEKGYHITDLFIAVHRPYNHSDYIPCIAWGRSAIHAAKEFGVGDKIRVRGSVQAREYRKRTPENPQGISKIAYEVSIKEPELVEKFQPRQEVEFEGAL